MDGVDQHGAQKTPEQGKEKADPAPDMKRKMTVVPEGDMEEPVVKERHEILRPGGSAGGAEDEKERTALDGGGQGQYGQGAKAVHRAQGQKIEALPVPLGMMGHPGKQDLQKKSQKAVYHKKPEPTHHGRLPLLFV